MRRRAAIRHRLGSTAALLLLCAPRWVNAAPACLASTRVEPESALLGQQVLYAVRILRRDDVAHVRWLEPLAFPGFRSEWLPAQLSSEHEERSGARYLVVEERRALFPARTGDLEIPPARLSCTRSPPREAGVAEITDVPGTLVQVREPPAAGRPEDFRGVVGRIEVRTRVEPRALALGETVRVSILVRGDANLWNVEDPLAEAGPLEGAEVFARRPDLALEAGMRLRVRRSFAYDVVPRLAGRLSIPGARVPYFDPERGVYAVAVAPPASVRVEPRHAQGTVTAEADRGSDAPRRASDGARSDSDVWPGALLALALGAGCLVGALRMLRARLAAARRFAGVATALREADASRARGDPRAETRALSGALRAALCLRLAAGSALDAEELLARAAGDPPAEVAARLLVELDRARFEPVETQPDADGVKAALRRLRPRLWRLGTAPLRRA